MSHGAKGHQVILDDGRAVLVKDLAGWSDVMVAAAFGVRQDRVTNVRAMESGERAFCGGVGWGETGTRVRLCVGAAPPPARRVCAARCGSALMRICLPHAASLTLVLSFPSAGDARSLALHGERALLPAPVYPAGATALPTAGIGGNLASGGTSAYYGVSRRSDSIGTFYARVSGGTLREPRVEVNAHNPALIPCPCLAFLPLCS